MERKHLNIGLFGFGCVGEGLYQVLQQTPSLKSKISKICIKNSHKKRSIESNFFTVDKYELLNDPEINVIVELIDDSEAAFEIVRTALIQGKAVVTANKKMIADHFDELIELQQKFQVPLLYEAAVCASIPIIRNLEEYYDNDLLNSLEGIVNGSTNYILTKTKEEGISYSQALKQAQDLGFAESNPILDTGGYDAKFKLIILLAHAFGIVVKPKSVFHLGIDKLGELEFNYAQEKGLKIKLIAQAYKDERDEISAFVAPQFIHKEHKLFQVDDVFNGIVTQTVFSDTQFFSGKGAGAYPTASAVISDISALSYLYKYEYKKLNQNVGKSQLLLKQEEEVLLSVLMRYSVDFRLIGEGIFEDICEHFQKKDGGYVVGRIKLNKLRAVCEIFQNDVGVVLFANQNG